MDFKKDVIEKRKAKKTKIVTEKTFAFTGDKIKYQLKYQGNGTAPDKRYDSNCEGMCLFISPPPNENITFYAFKLRPMFNKKKGKMEKNNYYKKIFRYADAEGFKYRDAKDQLKEKLYTLSVERNKVLIFVIMTINCNKVHWHDFKFFNLIKRKKITFLSLR